MKLKIATHDSYNPEERKRLAPFIGTEVSLESLLAIARDQNVAITLVPRESDAEWIAIDSPESW